MLLLHHGFTPKVSCFPSLNNIFNRELFYFFEYVPSSHLYGIFNFVMQVEFLKLVLAFILHCSHFTSPTLLALQTCLLAALEENFNSAKITKSETTFVNYSQTKTRGVLKSIIYFSTSSFSFNFYFWEYVTRLTQVNEENVSVTWVVVTGSG